MNAKSINLRIDVRKDPDLYALYEAYGARVWRRIAEEALLALVTPGFTGKEAAFIRPLPHPKGKGDVKLTLSLGRERFQSVRDFLQLVEDRRASFVIKQAMRAYLGPAICFSAVLSSPARTALESLVPAQVFVLGEMKEGTTKRKNIANNKSGAPKGRKEVSRSAPSQITSSPVTPLRPLEESKPPRQEVPASIPEILPPVTDNPEQTALVTEEGMLALLSALIGE